MLGRLGLKYPQSHIGTTLTTVKLQANMPIPWLFVSPASRGIGLRLTRLLLQTTDLPVIVTARTKLGVTKDRILEGLDIDRERLEVLKVDVTGNPSFHCILVLCKV